MSKKKRSSGQMLGVCLEQMIKKRQILEHVRILGHCINKLTRGRITSYIFIKIQKGSRKSLRNPFFDNSIQNDSLMGMGLVFHMNFSCHKKFRYRKNHENHAWPLKHEKQVLHWPGVVPCEELPTPYLQHRSHGGYLKIDVYAEFRQNPLRLSSAIGQNHRNHLDREQVKSLHFHKLQ